MHSLSERTEVYHKCTIPLYEDEVVKYIDGGFFVDTRRKFRRFMTVSDTGLISQNILRSSAAIREEKTRHLQQAYYMIHPFSNARRHWEEIMIFVFLCLLVLIPIKTAIHFIDIWYFKVPKAYLDIICCCDICITFACGYYKVQTKKIILSRKKVAMHYLTTYFFIDLFSSAPNAFANIAGMNWRIYKIFNYVSYLKILRIGTFLRYLDELRDRQKYSVYKFKIFKLMLVFFIGLLWTTSFYHVYRDKWHTAEESSEIVECLLTSCLCSLCNLLLVGHGLEEIRDIEILVYVILCLIIGVALRMFIYAQALHMLHSNLSVSNKYQDLMQQLQEFIRYKHLPESMRRRILQFFDFKFERNYYKESEIWDTLSENLKQDIVLCICENLIEKVEFFHDLPATLLMKIVKCMKSEIFLRGDVIVKAGSAGECMYFISSGTIAVYTENGKEICHLSDGSHFGEVSLIMDNEKRIASVIAIECCDLYTLSRKDFQKAVAPYPELKYNMKKLAEKRLLKTMVVATNNEK